MKDLNREFFINPVSDPDYSVSGFWFWNDLITDEKTREQLKLMKHIHANQPVVHARFGLENEYLSEDWFARIADVIESCKENEQKIWLYDENNWPSGNCSWSITKEEQYREHFLNFETITLKKGELFEDKQHKYISAAAFWGDPSQETQFQLMNEDGYLSFLAQVDTQIVAMLVAVDPYEPVGKFCVDYLSKDAIRIFLDSTHEKYREHFEASFGTIIQGIFMDETRFCNALPWTQTLPDEFQKRKGYDLLPYLPLLVKTDAKSKQVRFDYFDVISDLYTEATFKQIFDWCNEHQLKTIGHFLGEETLATQSYFGADMMRGYQYFHVPGIDHLGNGIGSLDAKFAVSASQNYGKSRIACEAFGASGWDMSYEDMVRVSNWLFQQGINLIIMHGFYYSIRGERSKDFPPSYFYQWKYWDNMPTYVKMANRMMEMLSNGRIENEMLVYAPMETFWNYFEPDLETKTGFWEEGPWIKDAHAKKIDCEFQLLCNKLTDRNLDYTIFNADATKNFEVCGKQIVNKLTGAAYEVFVLPFVEILTKETADLLTAFMNAGGTVISYATETIEIVHKDGSHMRNNSEYMDCSGMIPASKLSEIIDLCKSKVTLPFEILSGVDEMSHSKSSYPARLIDPYIHDGERVYGVGVTRYRKENHRIFNLTNYNEKEEDLQIWIESASIPEVFIPETGDIISQKNTLKQKNGYVVSLTLPANRSIFLVGTY